MTRSSTLRLALFSVFAVASSMAPNGNTLQADVIVSSRHSYGDFFVVAAGSGVSDSFRITDESTELEQTFLMQGNYSANIGVAFATGAYTRRDAILSQTDQLTIFAMDSVNGRAAANLGASAIVSATDFYERPGDSLLQGRRHIA